MFVVTVLRMQINCANKNNTKRYYLFHEVELITLKIREIFMYSAAVLLLGSGCVAHFCVPNNAQQAWSFSMNYLNGVVVAKKIGMMKRFQLRCKKYPLFLCKGFLQWN